MKKLNKSTLISIVGATATLIGILSDLLSDWSNTKATEELIDSKIEEKLAERENTKKEES